MAKFITLTEAYRSIRKPKKKRKVDEYPATHAEYMAKHFPDEEVEPEPEKYDFELEDEDQRAPINRHAQAYNTNFADTIADQMYSKPKKTERKLTPDEVYASMYYDDGIDDDLEAMDPHLKIPPLDMGVAHFWSALGKSLYRDIETGTKAKERFELDRDGYNYYNRIKSQELYDILDQALEVNLDISDTVWDLMEDKNKKLYTKLRKSMGVGAKPTPVSDYELFKILKWHPEYTSRKNTKYKENAGKYKLKDIKKRIRNEFGDSADSKIAELKQYINKNRNWPLGYNDD